MKQLLIFSTFLVLSTFCKAQSPIIQKANIEFERKVNVWADLTGSFADEMKKNIPEYQTSFFNFESDGNKAIYKPGRKCRMHETTFSDRRRPIISSILTIRRIKEFQ